MKKILKYFLIFLLVLFIRFLLSFTVNEIIILNYNNDIYNSFLVKSLYIFNINQPYIAYYNEGNILYRKEQYDLAIKKYENALKKNPSKKKTCDIRINMSLSMIKQIDFSSESAYDLLDNAKNNLYNNNCANPIDNSGISKEAEELEEEIKKLQEQLSGSSSNNTPNDPNEDPGQEQELPSNIEERIREIERGSNESRQEEINNYEGLGNYIPYSGKRW